MIFKCNLFRIYWGRSTPFILIPDLYIHELPTKHPRGKILDPRTIYEKIFWTYKNTHEKKFGRTNYPRDKILDPQNTREKKFGRTKYPRDKILDARNTREKKFGRTKYPRDEILDLRNTHETKFWTYEIAAIS